MTPAGNRDGPDVLRPIMKGGRRAEQGRKLVRKGRFPGTAADARQLSHRKRPILRAGGLVSARRSSADGRDSYYRIELTRCRELLAETGMALHPGLAQHPGLGSGPGSGPGSGALRVRTRVLFLCTGNSARSQLAEALLGQLAGGAVDAASAGSRPKPLHPEAVRVMREHGIDISGWRSKHLEEFAGQRFGYVITLCDRVREVCPEFPGHPRLIHWSIADPAGEADPRAAFRRVAAELRTRIGFLLARLGE